VCANCHAIIEHEKNLQQQESQREREKGTDFDDPFGINKWSDDMEKSFKDMDKKLRLY
jgi:hypothetical protein